MLNDGKGNKHTTKVKRESPALRMMFRLGVKNGEMRPRFSL